MEDKELFDIWKKNDQQETVVYEKYKEEYEQVVKKQSDDVFKKIKKNIVFELIFSVVIGLALIPGIIQFYIRKPVFPTFLILLIVFVYIMIVINVALYSRCLIGMKSINEQSILESLRKKIDVLSSYIKQLKITMIIFTPFLFCFGVYVGFFKDSRDFDLYFLIKVLLISIPITLLFVWSCKKYLNAFYGKHLVSIKKIYEDFLNES